MSACVSSPPALNLQLPPLAPLKLNLSTIHMSDMSEGRKAYVKALELRKELEKEWAAADEPFSPKVYPDYMSPEYCGSPVLSESKPVRRTISFEDLKATSQAK